MYVFVYGTLKVSFYDWSFPTSMEVSPNHFPKNLPPVKSASILRYFTSLSLRQVNPTMGGGGMETLVSQSWLILKTKTTPQSRLSFCKSPPSTQHPSDHHLQVGRKKNIFCVKVGPATMVETFPLVIATKYNIPMLLGNLQVSKYMLHIIYSNFPMLFCNLQIWKNISLKIIFIPDCEGRGHHVEGEVYKIDQRMLEHLGASQNLKKHLEFRRI